MRRVAAGLLILILTRGIFGQEAPAVAKQIKIAPGVAATQPLTRGELPVITADSTPDMLMFLAKGVAAPWQINVRKSFASKLDAQKPANLSYVTSGKQQDLYNIDIAVAAQRKTTRFELGPVVEWHRDSTSEKPKNRLSFGGTADGQLFSIGQILIDSRIDADLVRDFHKNQTGGVVSLLFSPYRPDPEAFMASTLRSGSTGAIRATFYPYVGAERWHRQAVRDVESTNVTMALARIEVKFLPFNPGVNGVESPFEIVTSYTYRHPFDEDLENRYDLFSAEANYFLDQRHRLAIGFSYQNGSDPEDDFANGHKGVVALRLKI